MSDDEDSNPKGGDARFLLAIYIIFPTLFGLYVFALCCGGPCCYCLNLLDEWSLSRNNSRRPSVPRVLHVSSVPNDPNVPDDPPETETDRLEGEPRVSDVCITPWHPLCSQSDPLPGRLELDRRGKNDVNRTANSQNRPRWKCFLPLSADKVSDADPPLSPPGGRGGSSTQHTPSTQIRVSTIVLMPALPPGGHTESPGEYALGTSYLSCAPE